MHRFPVVGNALGGRGASLGAVLRAMDWTGPTSAAQVPPLRVGERGEFDIQGRVQGKALSAQRGSNVRSL